MPQPVEETLGHTPVLADEVRALLEVRSGETVVDATVGLGGHALLFAERLGPTGTLIALDVDPENLAIARERLSDCTCRIEWVHANFADLRPVLAALSIDRVHVLFADLGVSSTQLDQPTRGFSFLRDGPLDMRMDPRATTTAADLVNRLKDRELGDLIYHNSQEPGARRIARWICAARRDGRITTTGRLAAIVADALGVNPASRRDKIHPATRTFQALRMAVNEEIPNLESFLEAAPDVLHVGGRIGLIAFHSVEDKVIKTNFRRRKSEEVYRIVTKKPVVAEEAERRSNPRSRSGKLRVAVRLP